MVDFGTSKILQVRNELAIQLRAPHILLFRSTKISCALCQVPLKCGPKLAALVMVVQHSKLKGGIPRFRLISLRRPTRTNEDRKCG
jgi:hypothetical protein